MGPRKQEVQQSKSLRFRAKQALGREVGVLGSEVAG